MSKPRGKKTDEKRPRLLAPYRSYLHLYAEKIKSGQIVAGTHIKQGIRRFLDDFDNPELRIDLSESDKRIRFIEHECKLYEAPFSGRPFRLELFQKAIIESIYAIKKWNPEANFGKGGWVRKYQDVLILIARKNGKTPLVAAISLSEFMCGEMGTKILYGSNDFEQADLAFSATDAMREESPSMAKRTRRNQKGIFFGNPKHRKTKGKYSYQNKGSIRKISANGKNKEGRNIKVGVVDEVHEMEDDHLIMPIQQALSTQDEPLYFEITTEGFTEDGYLDHRLADAQKVLDGELDRPDWAIWWYSQDSEEEVWQDEKSWQKSNPGIGVIKKWSYLRKQVEEAKSNPSQRAFVLAKDFNIKQNSSAAWLDEATIANTETFDPEMLRGQYYIGGLDFAETTDLCSARALFEDQQTKKKYTLQMYFIPEAKADAILDDDSQLNPERKNYREWEKQGLVVICPGAEVDAELVASWFVDLYEHYGMMPYKIGYDNWHSKDFQEIIADNFGKEVLERIGMDFMSLSGPMRSLESDLGRNVLVYNNNEIDRWCLSNTGYKTNNIGLIMPVKKYGTSKNRIDGTLSDIICYATFNHYRSLYRDAQKMR
ncbi:terminase large subunit [uncultured Mitsuokella sp.]|uniref:terminase large subunit n=1 Tax=uncultured Mitsuokella sp. TaxID=453120 RepID=UPI00259A5AFB|nr:terminase TerL endonuclease subunit [uncultured Mitsuokella sp.]